MIIEMKGEQTEFVNEHKKDALKSEHKELTLYSIYWIRPAAAAESRPRGVG